MIHVHDTIGSLHIQDEKSRGTRLADSEKRIIRPRDVSLNYQTRKKIDNFSLGFSLLIIKRIVRLRLRGCGGLKRLSRLVKIRAIVGPRKSRAKYEHKLQREGREGMVRELDKLWAANWIFGCK